LTGERCLEVVRAHWGVENRLHWRLDVVMNEDQQRNRSGNGPTNLAVLRHMALNVMQKDTTKGSLRGKIKRAGWDERYLKTLLTLFCSAIALPQPCSRLWCRLSPDYAGAYRGRKPKNSVSPLATPLRPGLWPRGVRGRYAADSGARTIQSHPVRSVLDRLTWRAPQSFGAGE
jgi:hypothetical protein